MMTYTVLRDEDGRILTRMDANQDEVPIILESPQVAVQRGFPRA